MNDYIVAKNIIDNANGSLRAFMTKEGDELIKHIMDTANCSHENAVKIIEDFEQGWQVRVKAEYEKNHEEYQNATHQVKCPKCGFTQIQMVPRKWSLMTGFFTNKVDRVCVNCKHKF